ncbi:uncharacterized protein LOC107046140, partial [Diachasma alloeum]|uniref:uncharacterized protein LOC107046140 n=1 Tax=Diachasma alloeum TaxID=454923 RepID=UPI0007381FD4
SRICLQQSFLPSEIDHRTCQWNTKNEISLPTQTSCLPLQSYNCCQNREHLGYPSQHGHYGWLRISCCCHEATTLSTAILRILPNYCVTYILLALVMIVNPMLYVASTRDLETAVTCRLSQMTGRERKLVKTIKLKFALINIVYYLCWLPNLINGVLLWSLWFKLPVKIIITLWYIMVQP